MSLTKSMALCVGLVQFAPVSDLQANMKTVEQYISEVCAHGAKLIVIPEMWTCEYAMSTVTEHAEMIPGESSDFLCHLGKKFGVWIVGGTIPERRGDKMFNTCPIVSPSGVIVGTYSKEHLYKVNLPGRIAVDEGDVFSPGEGRFSFAVDGFKVGVGVCFDVRFPVLSIEYAVGNGCNVLVFPSAFTRVTGQMHWKLLGRARALDTQSWVVMVSSSYDENAKFKGNGQSFIANPMGEIVFELNDGPECGVFTIEAEAVAAARAALPVVNYGNRDSAKHKQG